MRKPINTKVSFFFFQNKIYLSIPQILSEIKNNADKILDILLYLNSLIKRFDSESTLFNIPCTIYRRWSNCFIKRYQVGGAGTFPKKKENRENPGEITIKINVVQCLFSTTRVCVTIYIRMCPFNERLRVQGHRVSRSTATRSQIKEADILSPFSFASPRPVSNRFARCQQADSLSFSLSLSGYSQVYRSCRVARLGFAYCRDSMTILRFQFFFVVFAFQS